VVNSTVVRNANGKCGTSGLERLFSAFRLGFLCGVVTGRNVSQAGQEPAPEFARGLMFRTPPREACAASATRTARPFDVQARPMLASIAR
jgi:hypothetical protein